jgi:hypothetical protein
VSEADTAELRLQTQEQNANRAAGNRQMTISSQIAAQLH